MHFVLLRAYSGQYIDLNVIVLRAMRLLSRWQKTHENRRPTLKLFQKTG